MISDQRMTNQLNEKSLNFTNKKIHDNGSLTLDL